MPISEIVPEASKNLHGGKKFWLRLAPDNFLPQFVRADRRDETGRDAQCASGISGGLSRCRSWSGKKADYAVTLERDQAEGACPALDDAFAAKLMPEKTLADLRHALEHDLEHEKEHEIERAKESQIVKFLHEHDQFRSAADAPEKRNPPRAERAGAPQSRARRAR